MTFTVRISGNGLSDDLRSLRIELISQSDWRGKVRLVERPPDPGTLGPVLEALQVLANPAAVSPLIAALVAWLRYRTSDVDLKVRRKTTTVTLSGKRLRQIDTAALTAEIEKLAFRLNMSDDGNSDE
jgi:hypothetical protein